MMTMVDVDTDDSEINLVVILIPDRNWMWRTKGWKGWGLNVIVIVRR